MIDLRQAKWVVALVAVLLFGRTTLAQEKAKLADLNDQHAKEKEGTKLPTL